LEEVVVAVLVEVSAGWRAVGLVFVVRAGDSLGLAQQAGEESDAAGGAADRPGGEVAVHDCTIG